MRQIGTLTPVQFGRLVQMGFNREAVLHMTMQEAAKRSGHPLEAISMVRLSPWRGWGVFLST